MTENLSLDLTDDEREVLLRGLRFVSSSISMYPCDPTPEVRSQRQKELQNVAALATRLSEPSASASSQR